MGPGVGGYQAVGGVQAAGQGGAHHREGDIGLLGQRAADGREDYEAGVAEHGDAGDVAHGAYSHHAVLFTH